MATFHIKATDESPALQTTLKDASGSAVNLTGASVVANMTRIGATARTIDGASVTIDNASGGVVSYAFDDTETATWGIYRLEWVATYADATQETFPNQGYDIVQIGKGL